MMKKTLLLIFVMSAFLVFPQQKLEKLIMRVEQDSYKRNNRIDEYLKAHPDRVKSEVNKLLWNIINDKPIYVENLNEKAEKALRTNFLKAGILNNLQLTGNGLTVGLWEVGGIPELLHKEFIDMDSISRIIVKDNSTIETSHATHVAGTLIAKGVEQRAEGMAKDATILSYTSKNDLDEVINALKGDEILISNHSYGVPVENAVEAGAEWLMGAYSNRAKFWDEIINQFPYYTAFFAGGNDGNTLYKGALKGGYDKLTTVTNSKNVIVVANASTIEVDKISGIFTDADINSSSSQGPTDDGRIKPDITGLGTSIISTTLGNKYATATGTSMASPNTAGSALLLQELYHNINGEFMLSSTLKGLISATADDAGIAGPDPKFGWGVMNSKRAAEAIINNGTEDIIEVDTLNQDENHNIRVENTSGKIMKVALAWNDPAGTAFFDTLNDPTPVLVNDLDMRITNLSNQEESFPWKLSLEDVSAAAQPGDNIVDNIEIIEISEQGVFDIKITHKGDILEGSQRYSLIILNGTEQSLSNENFGSQSISFWPNPVKNQLNISSAEVSFSKEAKITIYDMTGREVMNRKEFDSAKTLNVDMSSLSKGIYILKLIDGTQSIQKRIIKE